MQRQAISVSSRPAWCTKWAFQASHETLSQNKTKTQKTQNKTNQRKRRANEKLMNKNTEKRKLSEKHQRQKPVSLILSLFFKRLKNQISLCYEQYAWLDTLVCTHMYSCTKLPVITLGDTRKPFLIAAKLSRCHQRGQSSRMCGRHVLDSASEAQWQNTGIAEETWGVHLLSLT